MVALIAITIRAACVCAVMMGGKAMGAASRRPDAARRSSRPVVHLPLALWLGSGAPVGAGMRRAMALEQHGTAGAAPQRHPRQRGVRVGPVAAATPRAGALPADTAAAAAEPADCGLAAGCGGLVGSRMLLLLLAPAAPPPADKEQRQQRRCKRQRHRQCDGQREGPGGKAAIVLACWCGSGWGRGCQRHSPPEAATARHRRPRGLAGSGAGGRAAWQGLQRLAGWAERGRLQGRGGHRGHQPVWVTGGRGGGANAVGARRATRLRSTVFKAIQLDPYPCARQQALPEGA